MPLEITKIRELESRYDGYDRDGTEYYYQIEYTTPNGGEQMVEKIGRGKGLEAFRKHIDELVERIGADSIFVTDFNGKSANAKQKNPTMNIVVKRSGEDKEYIPQIRTVSRKDKDSEEQKPFTMNGFLGFQGLEQLGGLEGYFQLRENLSNEKLEKKLIEATKNNLETEVKVLRDQVVKLEKENDKLYDTIEKLQDENGELQRYVPENGFKIMGMDGTKVLGSILGNAAINIAKKNPAAAKKVLGNEFMGLLGLEDLSEQEPVKTAQVSEADQMMHEACTQIFEYCQSLDKNLLSKVYEIFNTLSKGEESIDEVLYFIRQKRKEADNS